MKNIPFLALVLLLLAAFSACKKERTIQDFNPADHSIYGDDAYFLLPMIITPNGDFINDEYRMVACQNIPGGKDEISSFYLEVRKNNKKVYATQDIDFRWNGNDPLGKHVTDITEVTVKIAINGKPKQNHKAGLYILRDYCVPEALQNFMFGDMIDPRYGAIYNTMETFCQ